MFAFLDPAHGLTAYTQGTQGLASYAEPYLALILPVRLFELDLVVLFVMEVCPGG